MAEADAEQRPLCVGAGGDEIEADPGLVGRAGTGRDENRPGAACQRLDRGQRIVALDAHFGPQLDQIMDEVEGEAVVIVDDEDHGALLPVTRHARKRSEEHTSELQSLMRNSYAVLFLT